MLIEDTKWFGQKISMLEPSKVFPLLNVGSSTAKFREVDQPWIDQNIFQPFKNKGRVVKHLDIKAAPGVDIVGDITDSLLLEKLSKMGFKSIFCTSLLEHVNEREKICEGLVRIIPHGGYLFVECPFRYPFHPDPIDNMFRPNIQELTELFPHTHIVDAEIITCGTQIDYIGYKNALKSLIRVFMPFYKSTEWTSNLNYIPWFFKHFKVTCLVLKKD